MRQCVISFIIITGLFCQGCARTWQLTWSWGPVVPKARSSRATTVVADRIISIGGTYWVDAKEEKTEKIWDVSVYQLNVNTMQWQRLPDYPLPTGYGFAATVGNKVYVIGGRGSSRAHKETFILNLKSDQMKWLSGPNLPSPRYADVGGVIDQVIYIAGGYVGEISSDDPTIRPPNILALDTQQMQAGWKYISDLPCPDVRWPFGTTCASRLYLFGGMKKESVPEKEMTEEGSSRVAENSFLPYVPQDKAFSYDINTGQWKTLQPLPTPKLGGACVALDDRYILIVGGVDLAIAAQASPDGRPRINFSTECWLYDTIRDRYKALMPLKKAVVDMGIVYTHGKLYVVAGEGNPFKTRTDLVQIGAFR